MQLPLIAFVDGRPTSWFHFDPTRRVWQTVLTRRDAVNDRLSRELLTMQGPAALGSTHPDIRALLDLARLVEVLDGEEEGCADAGADRLVRWAIRRMIRGWRRQARNAAGAHSAAAGQSNPGVLGGSAPPLQYRPEGYGLRMYSTRSVASLPP